MFSSAYTYQGGGGAQDCSCIRASRLMSSINSRGTKGSACNAASAASMSTKPRWEACSNMPSLNFHAKYSVNVLGDVYRNLKTSGRPSLQGIGVEP